MPYRPPQHKTAAVSASKRHNPEGYEERNAFWKSAAWKRMRLRMLKAHPICEHCKREPAKEVHHVESLRKAPERRLDPTNLRCLCKSCHSKETIQGN